VIGALALSPIVQSRVKMTLDHLTRTEIIMEGKFDPEFPRPFMFHQAFKMIAKSPLIGIGTGSMHYYTKETGHVVNHPHNSMLYMQVSFGILGLISFFWLFGKMFFISYRNRDKPLGYLLFSICLVIFWGGFFDTLIINSGTSLLLPMGYGMLKHRDAIKV
jgi:O-antigen ligase